MLNQNLSNFLLGYNLKLITTQSFRGGYMWHVHSTASIFPCLQCGSNNTVKAGICYSTVKEEPIRSSRIWLRIKKHRVYCKSCKTTKASVVEGVEPGKRSTQRFRKFIALLCAKSTDISTVCRLQGVSSGFAYKVFYEQIQTKLRERGDLKWPEVIGIDEHFFRRQKGVTEFVTLFADLVKNRAFELAIGKSQANLVDQIKNIHGNEHVKIVVIDMSNSYKSFVRKLFPNAIIIADKFHVLRMFFPYIMKEGASIHGHRAELKTRRKLLRNRTHLDYYVRCDIDRYLKDYPVLNELYRCKEKLFEFYRIRGTRRAVIALHKLIALFQNSQILAIQKIAKTLKRWRQEILAYFEFNYTNAFTERTNGTGKLVQRRGFGYKSFINYRLRMLSVCLFKTF